MATGTRGVSDGSGPMAEPVPDLPSRDAVAAVYDAPAMVARVAQDLDPGEIAKFLNELGAHKIKHVRRLVGLHGSGRLSLGPVKELIRRLATPGAGQVKVLDEVANGSIFEDFITPTQWVQLLHGDSRGFSLDERSRAGFIFLHALVQATQEYPHSLLDLADGVRRGGSGATLALAILASEDERAATAFRELARDFPALPQTVPDRDLLDRVLSEVLGLDRPELNVDGDEPAVVGDLPIGKAEENENGDVEEASDDAADEPDEPEHLIGRRWDAAREAAEALSIALSNGRVPTSPEQAAMLARFIEQLSQTARALDAQTRDELREAIEALRRSNIDPARKWLLRLAAMEGPAILAASIAEVGAIAQDAVLSPEHARDEALYALLTLIDLAAQRAAGSDADWEALASAQQTAAQGLPEHMGLVMAAVAGRIHAPAAEDEGVAPGLEIDALVEVVPAQADLGAQVEDSSRAENLTPAPGSVGDDEADSTDAELHAEGSASAPHVANEITHSEIELEPEGAPGDPIADRIRDGESAVTSTPPEATAHASTHGRGEPAAAPNAQALSERELAEPQVAALADNAVSTKGRGADSQIVKLITEHRESLAYLVAKAHSADDVVTRALAFFAGANACQPEWLVAEATAIWLDSAELAELSPNDHRIILAAVTRIALSQGYDPTGQLETYLDATPLDDYEAADSLRTIVTMAAHGFQRPEQTVKADSTVSQWTEVAQRARDVLSDLRTSKISFVRASLIIRHLARDTEPLGEHLVALEEIASAYARGDAPSDKRWQGFRDFALRFQDPGEQQKLIASADRKVSIKDQLRKTIDGSAKRRMDALIGNVASLFAQAVAIQTRTETFVKSDQNAGGAVQYLAAREALSPVDITTIGDAALARLVDWILADSPELPTATTLDEVINNEIAPLFEIERDEAGRPERDPRPRELEVLVSGREPIEVVRGYLDRGNRQAAEEYIARNGLARTDALADELREATGALNKRHKDAFARASRTVSRVRALNEDIDEQDSLVSFAGRLAALEDLHSADRVDLTLRALKEIEDEATVVLDTVRGSLRERAHRNVEDDADLDRILGLIESGDETLAVEYLTLIESGLALPMLEAVTAEDFAHFFPSAVRAADEARKARRPVIPAVREHLGKHGAPDQNRLSLGLAAWSALAKEKQGKTLRENVADVVRLLGLNPEPSLWLNPIKTTKNAGFASFSLRARPADGSYVPSFGTKAQGRYDLTLVWEEVRNPQALLQKIDFDRQNEPNVILYFGTLSIEQRIQLRKLSARNEFSPIVIDEAVVGWLSTREEPGWKLTQRVTLPFTTVNPYVPVGDVPDEVFVGREKERQAIIDPTGSMFVYGGRQLGKSALLRRVERGLNRESDRITVVYFDLKTANLGEAAPASELWPELAMRLEKVGVLESRRQKWTPDEVGRGVESWLEHDASRRLLLLLDEADNFLTYDANDTGRSGLGGFPVLQRLKGLMENSQGRFKPVFAGLHQVQRFHDMPNTPVAHGGEDILIGPLGFTDAQRLVADPLRALGFEFESPETVWQLLYATNYQASLIQIVCEALVEHMKSESMPKGGGRIVITGQHVNDVYAKRAVRDRISDRFRWTIQLDNRYRIIALVTAWLTFDATPGEAFSPAHLQEQCADFWRAGFEKTTLSSSEFRRYLEEMRGLGVLHRQDDGDYVLRSPNIRSLLGTKKQIEDELIEASENFEVEYRYNPTMNRRILEAVGVEGAADQRSPLPDADLVRLLDKADPVQFVIGSQALGISRMTRALEKVASEAKLQVVRVPIDKVTSRVRSDFERHLIIDLSARGLATDQVDTAIKKIAGAHGVHATVLLRADGGVDVDAVIERFPHVCLNRWTEDGLGAWQDSAFPTPVLRKRLKRVTGGWPEKVELAMRLVAEGKLPEAALVDVRESVHDERAARSFLNTAGVPLDVAATWVEYFGDEGADGLFETLPVTLDLLDETGELPASASEIVSRLQAVDAVDETSDGFVLDRLVAEAAKHLSS